MDEKQLRAATAELREILEATLAILSHEEQRKREK